MSRDQRNDNADENRLVPNRNPFQQELAVWTQAAQSEASLSIDERLRLIEGAIEAMHLKIKHYSDLFSSVGTSYEELRDQLSAQQDTLSKLDRELNSLSGRFAELSTFQALLAQAEQQTQVLVEAARGVPTLEEETRNLASELQSISLSLEQLPALQEREQVLVEQVQAEEAQENAQVKEILALLAGLPQLADIQQISAGIDMLDAKLGAALRSEEAGTSKEVGRLESALSAHETVSRQLETNRGQAVQRFSVWANSHKHTHPYAGQLVCRTTEVYGKMWWNEVGRVSTTADTPSKLNLK